MSDFPLLPDSSAPNRLPAPSPCKACLISKSGWITAMVATFVAAFFFFQFITHRAEAKLQRNNAELAQIETQSLKQQLFAERILAERQIADLAANIKTEPIVFAYLPPADTTTTFPIAVVAWQPAQNSGVLFAEHLPPPAADEDLRLWLEEKNGDQISAGAIAVDGSHTTKVEFRAEKSAGNIVRFLITRERKGSMALPVGPTLLSGTP